MNRSLTAAFAALAGCALALAGCGRDLSCTTEVTEGAGTFRASASGRLDEAELRRSSLRFACDQLCAAGGPRKGEGCVARCAVDAASGKIGARTTCGKEAAAR